MLNLRVGDSYVHVEPYVPHELEKLLTYWRKEMVRDERTRQIAVKGSVRRLYQVTAAPDRTSRLVTLPGLFSLIKARLTANGYLFSVIDERPVRPDPDMVSAMKGLRDYQMEGVYTLLQSRGGVMACATGWGKTRCMAALCRGWNQELMKSWGRNLTVVVSHTVDIANKNYADFCEVLGGERDVGLVHGQCKKFSDDIQVVTVDSLGSVAVEEAGLVIYDEVHTMTEDRAEQIGRATRALRYGFSATPTGRFDGSDLMVTGMVGPVVYSRTYQEAVEDGAVVPIRVHWVRLPRPEGWRDGGWSQRTAYYRHGVWRNQDMHRTIARISEMIPREMQTLVIVDKIEHMNGLMAFLSSQDFVAVHAEQSQSKLDENGFRNIKAITPKKRKELYHSIAEGELPRVISTGIYRQGVNFADLACVINAEGMGSAILAGQIPGRASRCVDGKVRAYIVDFWHPWDMVESAGRTVPGALLRDDKSREKVYGSLGFEQMWFDSPEQMDFN